ncbi:MAG: M61 family metallopeptidase [Deltaproteobacteria bacterium]
MKLGSLILVLSALAMSQPAAQSSAVQLRYHLILSRPASHLVEVEISADGLTAPQVDFVMPAWSPGRYAIYNFAKNVQEFEARDASGHPLDFEKTDKQTWRVSAPDAGGQVRVRYKVFANDLNGSFSQFDTSHANLNGASIFMYVDGHKPDPITLQVDAPEGWKIYSGYSLSPEDKTFQAPNYDRLIDTPLEVTPHASVATFTNAGKTFRIVVHASGPDGPVPGSLESSVERIVRAEMAMMPAPDFDNYTFLFHFAPEIRMGDGMEHLNSTQIIISGLPREADAFNEALEDASHEFFHVWNVKRLRPAGLGPFDYTKEVYSRSLWVAEGLTTYYSYVFLLRAGLWTQQQFLDRLAGEIRDLETEPGRKLMSAESSSFNAWFYDRAPQMQETNFANATISYYNKGALLGMLLDLEIRSQTAGEKSLDDVMRALYPKFYDAPAASYYLPGRAYEESDVLEALNSVSGSDFARFFKNYVRGTSPLPYASTLAHAGMNFLTGAPPGAPPSLGILSRPTDNGVKILSVMPGGAADRAGLSRDDLLAEVDGLSLADESLDSRLSIYPPGATVPFTVERGGVSMRVSITLDPPSGNQFSIVPMPQASPEQLKIRDGWLGK